MTVPQIRNAQRGKGAFNSCLLSLIMFASIKVYLLKKSADTIRRAAFPKLNGSINLATDTWGAPDALPPPPPILEPASLRIPPPTFRTDNFLETKNKQASSYGGLGRADLLRPLITEARGVRLGCNRTHHKHERRLVPYAPCFRSAHDYPPQPPPPLPLRVCPSLTPFYKANGPEGQISERAVVGGCRLLSIYLACLF